VDVSRTAIEKARRKIPEAFFTVASADELPYRSSEFERCLISFGLHHVAEEKRPGVLREANRVLVPGGSLYVFDYHLPEKGFGRLIALLFTRLDNRGAAFRMLDKDKLLRQIEEAGFVVARKVCLYRGAVQLLQADKKSLPITRASESCPPGISPPPG
jgi:demethylmenaquinone methyltransferase/2-methoxy-6-polyprenyl-1,4-benzoquinol methylase